MLKSGRNAHTDTQNAHKFLFFHFFYTTPTIIIIINHTLFLVQDRGELPSGAFIGFSASSFSKNHLAHFLSFCSGNLWGFLFNARTLFDFVVVGT